MIYLMIFVGFMPGILVGWVLNYYTEEKPLRENNNKLVDILTNMKKQGFVPQYDIEQPKPLDLAQGIGEH